jgi:threonyl-tRNA synthetase
MVKIILPDGSVKKYEGSITLLDVIKEINCTADEVLIVKVDGISVDLSKRLDKDCKLEIVTFDSEEGRKAYWCSTLHIMAYAVKQLFPKVEPVMGSVTEEGFYYDFDTPKPFTQEDLVKIEEKMNEISKKNLPFERIEISKEEALKLVEGEYKKELLNELKGDKVVLYKIGDFYDLCESPHVLSTDKIKKIKLLESADVHWKGVATNPMLQRIYGISFPKQSQLDEYVKQLEERNKRDHRRLGTQLDLFSIQDIAGPGIIFYHPKGATLRLIIEDWERKEHWKRGYLPVITPHLFKSDTWKKSGHYEYYKENMYFLEIEGQEYGIKPMNCPGHIMIYKARPHSYKELPIRYFEFGTVYRYEISGVLTGLFRVRGFTQDDAHIFCTPEQLQSEVDQVLDFACYMMKTFGFEYKITLSTRPEKCVGTEEQWERATNALKKALEEKNLQYEVDEGGGAFYGPKIDIKIKDAFGRFWQGPTIQVDFNLPERFDVTYIDAEGKKKRVVMIHRTVLGSMERFIGILIEHYGGAFPLWLSPIQIKIIPVADRHIAHAKKIAEELKKHEFRVDTDFTQATVEHKIREAQLEKIPYMIIVGDKEERNSTIAIRKRTGEVEYNVPLEEFINRISEEIKNLK